MKISYNKRFSKDGTVFNQAVSVTSKEWAWLFYYWSQEVKLGNPKKDLYVNGNDSNLSSFNANLERANYSKEVFLTLSQARFFNLDMKLPLKDRNTCILIRD
tara:strand:- start:3 stop:308 length:306 start_codon:yes stop_codon:yes gene_type:complete